MGCDPYKITIWTRIEETVNSVLLFSSVLLKVFFSVIHFVSVNHPQLSVESKMSKPRGLKKPVLPDEVLLESMDSLPTRSQVGIHLLWSSTPSLLWLDAARTQLVSELSGRHPAYRCAEWRQRKSPQNWAKTKLKLYLCTHRCLDFWFVFVGMCNAEETTLITACAALVRWKLLCQTFQKCTYGTEVRSLLSLQHFPLEQAWNIN